MAAQYENVRVLLELDETPVLAEIISHECREDVSYSFAPTGLKVAIHSETTYTWRLKFPLEHHELIAQHLSVKSEHIEGADYIITVESKNGWFQGMNQFYEVRLLHVP